PRTPRRSAVPGASSCPDAGGRPAGGFLIVRAGPVPVRPSGTSAEPGQSLAGQAAAERNLRTAIARYPANISTEQFTDAVPGCCIGQASEGDTPGLPKSSRQACTVALNGFQSATCRSQGVIWLESTKALDTNVTGNSHTSPPEVAASGVRTDKPITAPIQVKA